MYQGKEDIVTSSSHFVCCGGVRGWQFSKVGCMIGL
jgi:hypothetical protein